MFFFSFIFKHLQALELDNLLIFNFNFMHKHKYIYSYILKT